MAWRRTWCITARWNETARCQSPSLRFRSVATAGGIANAADSAGFLVDTLIRRQHPQPITPEFSVSKALSRETVWIFDVLQAHFVLTLLSSSSQSAKRYLCETRGVMCARAMQLLLLLCMLLTLRSEG